MVTVTTRIIPAAVVGLFAAALLKLSLTDRLFYYVRPSARRWVLLAGIALLILAVWTVLQELRSRRTDAVSQDVPEKDEHFDGHQHDQPSAASWLVLAPVLAVLVVAPPALGAYTAHRAPPANASGASARVAAGSSPIELSALSFYLVAAQNPQQISGRTVGLVGFVDSPHGNRFTLTRLVITCCAADAFAVTVDITAPQAAPAQGVWVHIEGHFTGMTGQNPAVTANTVAVITTPANPYG